MNLEQMVKAIADMDKQQLQQFCKLCVEDGCATQLEFYLHNEQLMFDLDIDDEEEL